MIKEDIVFVLKNNLSLVKPSFVKPSNDDWLALTEKFHCEFHDDFKIFMEEVSNFTFPGDILNVAREGYTNGNDTIIGTYDFEMKNGVWDKNLIPFYCIGNGDYFCLNSVEDKNSSVYYFYHDILGSKKYCDNFGIWIKDLPTFLK